MDTAAERMAALKRAYAEIILNVTKESSARVLAAEIKALRLQKELAASKEEAVGTLLRVKSIMDIKISETQKASLVQERRIQDLEALLGESKNTIKLLEGELEKVKEKMDNAMGSVKAPSSDLGFKQCCSQGDEKQCSCSPCSFPASHSPDHDPICYSPLDKETSRDKQNCLGDWHNDNSVDSFPFKSSKMIPPGKKTFCDYESLPNVMQMKESDCSRPGHTQRIHALEQNGVVQEECKDQHCKNGTVPPSQTVSSNINESELDPGKINLQNKVPAILSSRSLSVKRRKAKRKTKLLEKLFSSRRLDQILMYEPHKDERDQSPPIVGSDFGKSISAADAINSSNAVPSVVPSISVSMSRWRKRSEKRKRLARFSASDKAILPCYSLRNSRNSDLCSHGGDANASQFSTGAHDTLSLKFPKKEGPLETDVKLIGPLDNTDDKEVFRVSAPLQLPVEEASLSSDRVENVLSNTSIGNGNFSSRNSDSLGECGPSGTFNQASSNGFLKYTFKRKRLRGTSGSANEITANVKQNACDNDCGLHENQKTSSLASPCNSQKIAQVACQLISLSEKGWG